MKQEMKRVLDELALELEPVEFEELETAEERQDWYEAMRRLVVAGFAGDEDAWSIWSDMWKDAYGCRPRYTDAEIRRMYGIEERRA